MLQTILTDIYIKEKATSSKLAGIKLCDIHKEWFIKVSLSQWELIQSNLINHLTEIHFSSDPALWEQTPHAVDLEPVKSPRVGGGVGLVLLFHLNVGSSSARLYISLINNYCKFMSPYSETQVLYCTSTSRGHERFAIITGWPY